MPSNSNIRTNDPTKVPALPKIPASVTPELRRYLETLEQVTNIRLGRRGDPRDRAITLRELITSGLAQELAASPFNPNGTGTGFVPAGNTLVDLAVPPAPTGFSVTGAFSVINMSWNLANYGNHSHTEVWSHTSDVIGDATLTGITQSRVFSDPVGSGQTRYYWVRHVNTDNVVGPFNAAAGTVGQTAADVNHLLNVLNGAITSSELANALTTRIDLIDAADTVVNSVAYRVAQEASARAAAISAEATARANAISALILNEIPLYDSTAAYAVGQIVRISNTNSKLYICIQAVGASSSVAITDTNYWKLYGDYDSLKSSTDTSAAAITQINTISSSSTSAAALAINGLNSEVFASDGSSLLATASALNVVETEVFPQGTASASRLDTLDAEVFDANGNSLLATAAALTTIETEVFPNGTGSASRLDTLDAEVFDANGNSLLATAAALGTVTTEVFPNGTGSASRLDTLDAEVFDANGNSLLATAAALGTVTTEVFPTGVANASRLDTLDATVYDANGNVQLATASSVSTLETEVFPNGTSNASRLDALDNVLFDSSGNAIVSATNLTRMKNQILDTNGNATATATQMQQLGSNYTNPLDGTANNVSLQVALETSASQVNGLRGQYTVKLDANGAVAGFGLATTSTSLGTGESEFYVNADRFAIMRGGSDTTAAVTPFTVQATATTINGEVVPAGVYMTDAFIKNGSIVSAKIGSLAVDKITGTFAEFQSVLTGNLDANRINLDGTTLTSVNVNNGDGTFTPTLAVNAIAANQITSGVINTSRINLDDATITSDSNGQILIKDLGVDTLKIAGNAVTIPSSSVLSSDLALTTSYQDIVSITWTSTGAPTVVFVCVEWDGSGNQGGYVGSGQLKHGNTVVQTFSMSGSNNVTYRRTMMMNITPSIGVNTVTCTGKENQSFANSIDVAATNTSIFLLETKK